MAIGRLLMPHGWHYTHAHTYEQHWLDSVGYKKEWMLLVRIWVHLFSCLGFAVEEGCITMKAVLTVITGGCFCWHFYRHWVPNSTELTVWEPVLYYWQALPLSTWVWDGSDYLHLILKNRLLKMWRCVWRRIWSLSPPELSEKWLKSHHTAGSHLPRTTKFECWGTFSPTRLYHVKEAKRLGISSLGVRQIEHPLTVKEALHCTVGEFEILDVVFKWEPHPTSTCFGAVSHPKDRMAFVRQNCFGKSPGHRCSFIL